MARYHRSASSLPSLLKFSIFSLAVGISPFGRSSLTEEGTLEWKPYMAEKRLIPVVLCRCCYMRILLEMISSPNHPADGYNSK
jgi:hypothetical protein